MSGSEVIARRAARVLVIDASGRLLLLHERDPADPKHHYWVTVGGGIEEGESTRAAAVRELAEETGLRVNPGTLGEPIWRDITEFAFDGKRYRQEQVYFVVRVPSWEVDSSGFNAIERATVDEHRWWSPGEFTTTEDRYYPAELPELLRLVGVA
jgi:8-oxo-dGTP pyrophosphatase MutT (NUDIX family)